MTIDSGTTVTTFPVTNMTEDSVAEKKHQSDTAADLTAADEQNQSDDSEVERAPTTKSFGFYTIIVALALTSLSTSLEATITSTALPTVTADLQGVSLYVWVVNGYYLTQ